ncbi:MAG TPA: cyclophilin-like fold protein [Candidatus Polarisedimenticolia bacterium]|jgi:hypothetical protein
MTGSEEAGIDIRIRCGTLSLAARLDLSETGRKVAAGLPFESEAGRWGGEIYFEIPVVARLSPDARDVMQAGEIAYWPPGKALCIFWGKTPSSLGDEIRAASPVNVIGRMVGDPTLLERVQEGDPILVEKA